MRKAVTIRIPNSIQNVSLYIEISGVVCAVKILVLKRGAKVCYGFSCRPSDSKLKATSRFRKHNTELE